MSEPTIVEVDGLDARVESFDWPFAAERAQAIDRHWAAESAKRGGKLWNGRVLLCREPRVETRAGAHIFAARFFETDFKTFLAFRDWSFPDRSVRNCFAMAALRAADGPYLLARMGAHTANAGRIYFAAGTPDPNDVVGDRLDLEGSVLRELAEETGLTRADVEEAPGYTLVMSGGRIACLKEMRARMGADAAVARVRDFLVRENEPEIDGLVPVASTRDLKPDRMPDFIVAYLRAKLGGQPPG